MADKLNQPLEEIIKSNRPARRGRGVRRAAPGRAATTQAPVGGVQKGVRQAKQGKAAATAPAVAPTGEGKIMISNLPTDITEDQLKDYFTEAVGGGRPKKVSISYGPNGRSSGSAIVSFHKHDQAVKATGALSGVRIDNRTIRVEMLVNAANISVAAPPTLAERVTQPKKDKPKPATATKAKAAATTTTDRGGRGRGRGRARGGGREGRSKKKTVEELDAEMADYFPAGEGTAGTAIANGGDAAQATAGGDTAMDDEML